VENGYVFAGVFQRYSGYASGLAAQARPRNCLLEKAVAEVTEVIVQDVPHLGGHPPTPSTAGVEGCLDGASHKQGGLTPQGVIMSLDKLQSAVRRLYTGKCAANRKEARRFGMGPKSGGTMLGPWSDENVRLADRPDGGLARHQIGLTQTMGVAIPQRRV